MEGSGETPGRRGSHEDHDPTVGQGTGEGLQSGDLDVVLAELIETFLPDRPGASRGGSTRKDGDPVADLHVPARAECGVRAEEVATSSIRLLALLGVALDIGPDPGAVLGIRPGALRRCGPLGTWRFRRLARPRIGSVGAHQGPRWTLPLMTSRPAAATKPWLTPETETLGTPRSDRPSSSP